ncbi:helix-turn-helix domain-containing protein [Jiella avicenniae]|uniref:Helix-turn-helix domain-containing protein n=1 Tax=Jiella avicenniae TaxID=2907202 RepID=A0A9X1NWV6_9HYPH|nr:helix-turn-helix transcriptional regulator [Jiella avicenniae]MCE7026393.1 helix-turn-helix domain-containing protein [Jiella avicenniae]
MNAKSTNDTTAAIAAKIRARRIGVGISQETLAEALGITFQQVQKYEKGLNRISACRLVELAAALKCQPTDLLPEAGAAQATTFVVLPVPVIQIAHRIGGLPPVHRAHVVTVAAKLCEALEHPRPIEGGALEAAE